MSMVVVWLLVAIGVVLVAGAALVLARSARARSLATKERTSVTTGASEPAPLEAPVAAPLEVEAAAVVVAEPDTVTLSTQLTSARSLFDRVRALRGRTVFGTAEREEIEEALLRADVGTSMVAAVLDAVSAAAANGSMGPEGVPGAVRSELLALLGPPPEALSAVVEPDRVAVWLFVGVNGVGKTTTIGKLAAAETAKGSKVLLAAADTFRAAAADQLHVWAARAGCDVVRADEGADPGAVVHDALHRAASRGIPLVLADTAGRLHNKASLIEELKKIRRVADRAPGQVTEVLLVLDATTGQNAISQAREFSEAVGVTGIVLTKLDGTARGGVVLAVQRELGLPVRLVGVGERTEDLVAFDPDAFVQALLGD